MPAWSMGKAPRGFCNRIIKIGKSSDNRAESVPGPGTYTSSGHPNATNPKWR